jgi:hypothetical protein
MTMTASTQVGPQPVNPTLQELREGFAGILPITPSNATPENFKWLVDKYADLLNASRLLWQEASVDNLPMRQSMNRALVFVERTITFYCMHVPTNDPLAQHAFAKLRDIARREEALGIRIPAFSPGSPAKGRTPARAQAPQNAALKPRTATQAPTPAPSATPPEPDPVEQLSIFRF